MGLSSTSKTVDICLSPSRRAGQITDRPRRRKLNHAETLFRMFKSNRQSALAPQNQCLVEQIGGRTRLIPAGQWVVCQARHAALRLCGQDWVRLYLPTGSLIVAGFGQIWNR